MKGKRSSSAKVSWREPDRPASWVCLRRIPTGRQRAGQRTGTGLRCLKTLPGRRNCSLIKKSMITHRFSIASNWPDENKRRGISPRNVDFHRRLDSLTSAARAGGPCPPNRQTREEVAETPKNCNPDQILDLRHKNWRFRQPPTCHASRGSRFHRFCIKIALHQSHVLPQS